MIYKDQNHNWKGQLKFKILEVAGIRYILYFCSLFFNRYGNALVTSVVPKEYAYQDVPGGRRNAWLGAPVRSTIEGYKTIYVISILKVLLFT